jgi:hypothetical protein
MDGRRWLFEVDRATYRTGRMDAMCKFALMREGMLLGCIGAWFLDGVVLCGIDIGDWSCELELRCIASGFFFFVFHFYFYCLFHDWRGLYIDSSSSSSSQRYAFYLASSPDIVIRWFPTGLSL